MKFTADWFTSRSPSWEKILIPAFSGKRVTALELGSYEGRSAIWMLQNVLKHPESRLTCVDLWPATGGFEATFDANMLEADTGKKVTKLRGTVYDMLRRISGKFDLVYIDADHTAKGALTYAAMTWPMMNVGGLLIWDDYTWQSPDAKCFPPKMGIDAWLSLWHGEYEVVYKQYQVIIKKLK